MLQELEDGPSDGRAADQMLGDRGDLGGRKGASPGIIQQARLWQVVRPRNPTAETASAFPVAGAQQGAASEPVRALHCRHAE